MRSSTVYLTLLFTSAISSTALADSAVEQVQERNVKQQERIEQGLQSGALNTKEAAHLEKEQQRVNGLESRSLRDGTLSPAEQARINAAEQKASQSIYREKHDAQVGNPDSASSKRMQANVQRNVNQQERIGAGVENGSLNNHEVAHLERGEARVERQEARVGRDGHVSAGEERRVQAHENTTSRRIFRKKHNDR